jgi:Dyp-type peroxidase family
MPHKRSTALGGVTNLSVLAPIKAGMVVGFEPISYLDRLRKVLDALQSARQNVRESELRPPVFPDAIGRFGFIHHFRYAIVPPEPGASSQPASLTWRLSLNVTFDGGWEPYMRVIYRDLGSLLDLLFCHCDGYPGSRTSRFETYSAWVRANEVDGGIFYADSAMPLGDPQYLAAVEKVQREGADPSKADGEIARLALPSAAKRQQDAKAQALANPLVALVLPLRTLKGLYRLSIYFPKSGADEGDTGTLRRFAQSVLEGPRDVMSVLDNLPTTSQEEVKAAAAWKKAKAGFADELAWLNGGVVPGASPAPGVTFDPSRLQSHILGRAEQMTHGCLVLLRVRHADDALKHLATLAALCGPVPLNGIGYLIAFTHAGLQELGIAQQRLDALPQEFVDGMEARCGLLGDVRGNHPDHWIRPLAYEEGGHRVDMKAVHVAVQLRLKNEEDRSPELHSKLKATVDELNAAGTGLRVLAVQATRSYREGTQVSGHFGFADGLSQPQVSTGPRPAPGTYSDDVGPGELLLGHGNDRGDASNPDLDPLQVDGTFLVVRKLRQRVDNLDSALANVEAAQRDELLSKMMGRQPDGTPLVKPAATASGPNEFDYTAPAASDACPFHSHIRRANPRDGRRYTPRILRRGMSYGPRSDTDRTTERGVVFMAYCASIAEQFETVQRWVAGGNSSGVGSAQADPFLRVPQAGESNTFRYIDAAGKVARARFDDKPLVQLEWGLYLFVPALPTLRALAQFRSKPAAVKAFPPAEVPETEEQKARRIEEEARDVVRQRLDDPDRAEAAWKLVREDDPDALQDTPYGHLVGRYTDVLAVMKDDGQQYSVCEYGKRMDTSIGLNLLGMDPGSKRTEQLPLNTAIASIDEGEAFKVTTEVVARVLARFPDLPVLSQGDPVRRPIDLVTFSDHVLAALCTKWIGLPDEEAKGEHAFMRIGGRLDEATGTPRCPGNFATASRYIFSPQPRKAVRDAGQQQGQDVGRAVKAWLDSGPTLGTLAEDIHTRLGTGASKDDLALSLAGVLLGFPPTVHGNFIRTMETWIKTESLWQHQQTLFDELAAAPSALEGYAPAKAALRKTILATMRGRPVPEMLWRSPMVNGEADTADRNRVVLGIASALTDRDAPDELMFGRDRPEAKESTVHGCPGYEMATGVLLAMISGLMRSGTLRPTGSPVLLILTPN